MTYPLDKLTTSPLNIDAEVPLAILILAGLIVPPYM
jgi:hypothetical protein